MAAFRLNLLGRPALVASGGGAITGLPKKGYVIAAIAARSPHRRREKAGLAELLWPDLAPPQRANNLRQLLFRIRQFEIQHSVSLIESSDDDVRLSSDMECDLVSLEAVTSTMPFADVGRLMDLYSGRMLEGFSPDGHALRQWLSDQRLLLEDHFVDCILSAIETMPPESRSDVLNRAIKAAPTAIGPRKALMRQLIADGFTQEARRQYREIQHIGGHGSMTAPVGLAAEPRSHVSTRADLPPLPLGQLGRDEAGVPHLALLPPRVGSDSGHEGIVSEGLIDDVTVALTRLRSISILAPHTARKVVNGEDTNGIGLARADFVLRTKLVAGSPRYRGRSPQFTMLLERVASGDIVWAESIPLDTDLGPIQFAAIANGVALTLVDQIERATLRAFQIPLEAGAYGHYLLGQKALQVLDLPSTRRARASFKAAFSLSPNFAPAHTGYSQSMIYEWVMRGRGDMDLILKARGAAERAREIDPLFGSAHQMLGRASLFEGDFEKSLVHFEQAEALNPHHADLLCDFADTLMHSSLADRANSKIELALKLNPLAPDAYWWASAGIKFFVGEYDSALTHLGRIKNSEPVLRLTAACAAMAGQPELARLARNRFLATDPDFKLDDWIGVLPVKDPSHRRQYRQALQKAGFK